MYKLKLLTKKEAKFVINKIKKQFSIKNLNLDYLFFRNKEDKIFLVSRKLKQLNLKKLNINSIGLYFAKVNKEIRLSIEGSQLIGKLATKNILELNNKEANKWLQGNNIKTSKEFKGFVIIKNKEDYLGCGKFKTGEILNYVPKERRIKGEDKIKKISRDETVYHA